MADENNGHVINYKVNGEDESTVEKELTARQIMSSAGIDPNENYLEQQKPHNVSYKENSEVLIKMHENMEFITKPTGPMPVS